MNSEAGQMQYVWMVQTDKSSEETDKHHGPYCFDLGGVWFGVD